MLNLGVGWEESVPHKKYEFHEGLELDCLEVASSLGVFTQSKAEVEAPGD